MVDPMEQSLSAILFPRLALHYHVAPLRVDGRTLIVLASAPLGDLAEDDLAVATGHHIVVLQESPERVSAQQCAVYGAL